MSAHTYSQKIYQDLLNMGVLEYNAHNFDTDHIAILIRTEICEIAGNCQYDIRQSIDGEYIGVKERQLDIQIVYVSSQDDQFNNIITISKTEIPKLISILQSI